MSEATATLSQRRTNARGAWAGYAAALWALGFCVMHLIWAAGWYVGLNEEAARAAFQQRWLLIYDLVVAAICALGAIVAVALARPWERRVPRWPVVLLASLGTAVLVLRGGAGAVQTVYIAARHGVWSPRVAFWETWFCAGAILFALSTWSFWRASRSTNDGR